MTESNSKKYRRITEDGDSSRLVRLGPESAHALMELERACFNYHWTEEQFKLGLERGAFHVFGVICADSPEESLAAYLAFSLVAGEMEILNLGVRPKHRRQGLATRLMRAMLAFCREQGALSGFLDVKQSNHNAIDLYRKFGFIQCGVRKKYYPDTGEDALLFCLDFSPENGHGQSD